MGEEQVQQYLVKQLDCLAKSGPETPVTNATVQTLFHTWARIGEAEHHRSGRDDMSWCGDLICFGLAEDPMCPDPDPLFLRSYTHPSHPDNPRAFVWREVPDLFVDAIPIQFFLTNAGGGGPFHQWRMTRKDWLSSFRQFPPSQTRPPGPVTSLELAKLKDACALKTIVRGYLLRKMLAYQLNFTRLAQSWIVLSPAVRASGLHIADISENPEKGCLHNHYVDPMDDNVRTALQLRIYCFTDERFAFSSICPFHFRLEYRRDVFETDVELGYCAGAATTGGVRRVVVHRAVVAEEYVRFEYCLNDKAKTEESEKKESLRNAQVSQRWSEYMWEIDMIDTMCRTTVSLRMENQQEAERVAAGINAAIAIWQDGADSLHKELVRQSPEEKFDEVRGMMLCGPINMLCKTVWGRNSLAGCNELWGGNGESQRVGSPRQRVPFPGMSSRVYPDHIDFQLSQGDLRAGCRR